MSVDLRMLEGVVDGAVAAGALSVGVGVVAVDELRCGPLVRVMGEDLAYARLLAGVPKELPPVLVQRSSMMVIDGMHRLLAARLRGDRSIAVCFFDGDEAEGFVAAVRANVAHGKYLSLADREHAAERIMGLFPGWSDRVVAETCALSPKTVGAVRRRATGDCPQLPVRLGRDGRARPLDPVGGRERIALAVVDDPGASLRRIADQTGTSTGTVRDVRRRLAEGKDPVPERFRRRVGVGEGADEVAVVERPLGGCWANDAAFASTEEGRQFARWFDSTGVGPEVCERFVHVPALSRVYGIVAEAQARAEAWAKFAAALESRARQEATGRPRP